MRKEPGLRYRLNVAAILQNRDGKILVCERLDVPGAWQFPQGGVDPGETLEQAIARELVEEVSVGAEHCEIMGCKGPYHYVYDDRREKKGHHGKEQHFFLVRFTGPETAVNVATEHPEFRAARWLDPMEFRGEWLPKMKKELYRTVWRDFFDLSLT